MPGWMATDNRVWTITELVHLEVVYNERTERTYLELGDGHLVEAGSEPSHPWCPGRPLGKRCESGADTRRRAPRSAWGTASHLLSPRRGSSGGASGAPRVLLGAEPLPLTARDD
jgi:hypothetical protein